MHACEKESTEPNGSQFPHDNNLSPSLLGETKQNSTLKKQNYTLQGS